MYYLVEWDDGDETTRFVVEGDSLDDVKESVLEINADLDESDLEAFTFSRIEVHKKVEPPQEPKDWSVYSKSGDLIGKDLTRTEAAALYQQALKAGKEPTYGYK